jgi:ankyrin repeat protein
MIKPEAAEAVESRQQLLDAVEANDAKQLQSLLDSGASTDITDDYGNPLLHKACNNDASVECLRVLLAGGADVDVSTSGGGYTALHFTAIEKDKVATVKMLLDNGASVNAFDSYERTPLHFANSSETVTLLLGSGADIEAHNCDGETPLHHACRFNRGTAINALIKAGAKIDTVNNAGDTALHMAADNYTGYEAIAALIAAGARKDITNKAGKTAYNIACELDSCAKTISLLKPEAVGSIVHEKIANNTDSEVVAIDDAVAVDSTAAESTANTSKHSATVSLADISAAAAGAHIVTNSKNIMITAATTDEIKQQLLDAVKANDATQLQTLLDTGATATITDEWGTPLLQVACERAAAAECMQVILASGVDIETPDYDGRTALHNVAWRAAETEAKAAVKTLLAKGASIHATDRYKRTPLFYASNSEVVTVLLDSGAHIEARDSEGERPLHPASRFSKLAVVNALIRAGAKLDAVDDKGETPLHVAAWNKSDSSIEVFEALVAAGARLDIRNEAGETAYDIAVLRELDNDLLDLLRPAAASSSAVANSTDSEAVTTTDAVVPASTAAAAAAAAVAMSSSVRDALELSSTTQPSHTVATAPIPPNTEVNVLDTWLCKWLIDIGFDETEACKYTAEMIKLKCYKEKALATLKEDTAAQLAIAAGISKFKIDMFIAG